MRLFSLATTLGVCAWRSCSDKLSFGMLLLPFSKMISSVVIAEERSSVAVVAERFMFGVIGGEDTC